MKNKTWFGVALAALLAASAAQAQEPTWSGAQDEVWAYVQQSWVDDAEENGKWPNDYTHDKAISWAADWPFSQNKATWAKWTRFRDEGSQTLAYEISPNAITVVGNTAVVHYTSVVVTRNAAGAMERNVSGIVETLVREGRNWVYLSSVNMPLNFSD